MHACVCGVLVCVGVGVGGWDDVIKMAAWRPQGHWLIAILGRFCIRSGTFAADGLSFEHTGHTLEPPMYVALHQQHALLLFEFGFVPVSTEV